MSYKVYIYSESVHCRMPHDYNSEVWRLQNNTDVLMFSKIYLIWYMEFKMGLKKKIHFKNHKGEYC